MNINKIKIDTWYWVPEYATGIKICPWKVTGINPVTGDIYLATPSEKSETKDWKVTKNEIFVTRGEAVSADKRMEQHLHDIENAGECWGIIENRLEHVFLDSLEIYRGNIVSLQKEYLPNARKMFWGFHPEGTSEKSIILLPFFSVFATKEEATEAAEKIKREEHEKLRRLANKAGSIEIAYKE